MGPKLFLVAFIFAVHCAGVMAQTDSIPQPATDTNSRPSSRHPKRAALLSAALPGAGQAYNHKYWKMPIVYAGLGTSVFFIVRNYSNYRLFADYYAWDSDTASSIKSPYFGQTPLSALQEQAEQYRRWMEISFLAATTVYLLQIVDASVDAHLYYFDVSDDLSLRWSPTFNPTARGATAGLSLQLKF